MKIFRRSPEVAQGAGNKNPSRSRLYVVGQAVLAPPISEIRVETVPTWGQERYPGVQDTRPRVMQQEGTRNAAIFSIFIAGGRTGC